MSGDATRYRRSPYLLLQWQGAGTVVLQCDRLRRFRADPGAIALLSALDAWTDIDGLRRTGLEVTPATLAPLVAAGLVDARDDASGDGAEDGPGGGRPPWDPLDLAVHRRTNAGGARPADALQGPPPPARKPRPEGPATALPPPQPLPGTFDHVLGSRRSRRTYADRPLRLGELSSLLHHSARVIAGFADPGLGDCALRPFPGGGARSELELYVIAEAVEGLQPGAYYYDPREHDLTLVRPRDAHQERLLRWVHTTAGGTLNRDPQAVLLITAVFARIMWKYQGIGLSLVYKDVGCLFQTLYLVATALGLAPCALGGGEERENSRWLGLDPLVESQVGAFIVGPRAPSPRASGAPAEPRAEPAREKLLRMSQGFVGSALLRAGLELHVFDHLAAGPASPAEVATAAGADERGMRILLDSLAALGLVTRDAQRYSLSSPAGALLVEGRPESLAPLLAAFGDPALWDALSTLPEAVRRGGATVGDHAGRPDHPYWGRLATAMGAETEELARTLAGLLAPGLLARPAAAVLDLGCGAGTYGVTLAAGLPGARLALLDWPSVLPLAHAAAERAGIAGRTQLIAGDMFEAPLGGPYDVIILSQLLHHLDLDGCRRLLARAAAALSPDGVIAIHDFVREAEPPSQDPAPYLFSAILLAWTQTGEAHTLAALRQALADSDLSLTRVLSAPDSPTWFLLAEPAARDT